MTTIIIVRHGESLGNAQNLFLGHTNMDLTELGKQQAQKTAQYLQNYKIDAVYSSDLDRAYHTAEPTALLQGKKIKKEENLREVDAGDWEAVDYYGIYDSDPVGFTAWLDDIDNATCRNGESVVQMKARVTKAVDSIAKQNDGKTVAVFSHASPIKALFSAWTNKPMRDIGWVKNASVTVVEYNGIDDVKFIKTDYAEHLDGMITFLPDKV